MKKVFFNLISFVCVLSFVCSCNKAPQQNDNNSLVGTKWLYHYTSTDKNSNMIIEFTSNSTVSSYTVDNNFIATKEPSTGTYVENDGEITFKDFKGYYEAFWYDFQRAEITSSQTLKAWAYSRFSPSEKWSETESTLTFGKVNNSSFASDLSRRSGEV